MIRKKIRQYPLLQSSLIYTGCDAINKSVPFLILPVLSYHLSTAEYGVIANFNILISIFTIFITIGIDGAISVNYYRLPPKELETFIFNAIIVILTITGLLLLLPICFYRQIFFLTKIPFAIQVDAIIISFGATLTAINLCLWRLEEKPFLFGIYEISQTTINIGISLTLVVIYGMGWVGRVDGMLIAASSFGLVSLFLLYKRGFLKININKSYLREIILFGLPLIPHAMSFWIRSAVDRILITKFIGESATGLYATGFQFGILISFLTLSFNNAFSPYIFKKLSEGDSVMLNLNKKHLVKVTYICGGLLLVFCVVFTIFSNLILTYFFSSTYYNAKQFVFWAILSQTFQGLYLLFVNYIFFAKKTKLLAFITFGSAILQVILSLYLVPNYGAIGAAYSTVIVSFINFVAVALYSIKVYSMPWFAKMKTVG